MIEKREGCGHEGVFSAPHLLEDCVKVVGAVLYTVVDVLLGRTLGGVGEIHVHQGVCKV
jgi:hypothetical protein